MDTHTTVRHKTSLYPVMAKFTSLGVMHKTKEGGAVEHTGEIWVVYVQITNKVTEKQL